MKALVFAIGALLGLAALAEPQLRVDVTSQPVHANRQFNLLVTATGGALRDLDLPQIEGISIRRDPVRTNNEIKIVGGEVSRVWQGLFVALAEEAGEYELPAIKAQFDNGITQTEPVTIKVLAPPHPRNTPNAQQRSQTSNTSPPAMRGERQPLDDWSDLTWIETDVSATEVYQGEPVLLTMTRWQIDAGDVYFSSAGDGVVAPSLHGFYAVELQDDRERTNRNGYPYGKFVYRRLLFPTETGSLTIGSWGWDGQAALRGLFARGRTRHNYQLRADPIRIEVKPLPESPPDFSGAVGQFNVTTRLSPEEVEVGQPAEYVITIQGRGNAQSVSSPLLPELDNALVSGPEVRVLPRNSDTPMRVGKEFVVEIVPRTAGSLVLPPVSYVYFNPVLEEYDRVETKSHRLRVLPGDDDRTRIVADGGETSNVGEVDGTGPVLHPIVTNPGPLYAARPGLFWFVASCVAPALAYGALALVVLRRRALRENPAAARAHFARTRSQKRLAEVADSPAPAQELSKALTGFVADKLNVAEWGLTPPDVESLLREHGISEELIQGIQKTLRACERVSYASARLSPDEVDALMQGTLVNMDRLEDELQEKA